MHQRLLQQAWSQTVGLSTLMLHVLASLSPRTCVQMYEGQNELTEAREELELLRIKAAVAEQEAQAAKAEAAEAGAAAAAAAADGNAADVTTPRVRSPVAAAKGLEVSCCLARQADKPALRSPPDCQWLQRLRLRAGRDDYNANISCQRFAVESAKLLLT